MRVTLAVTDTVTGQEKLYENPRDTPFRPIQDTSAFATCNAVAPAALEALAEAEPGSFEAAPRSLGDLAESVVAASDPELEELSAPSGTCVPSSTSLCLNRGRFKVEATWRLPSGLADSARPLKLTGDTGYFWFFSPSNVEMVVKVLNGCPLGGHYWVFAGGLTDVNVELKITDTTNGAVRTYVNPPGVQFQPIQDTSAFGSCP